MIIVIMIWPEKTVLIIIYIKTHGRVSAAKEVVWHTSVLFTGTTKSPFSTHHISITTGLISIKFTDQDTRSCVSGQGSRVAHKCLIYRNH